MPGSRFFLPISKPPIAKSFAPMAVMAGQSSGGPPVTIVLLCACAMLLLASGIEPKGAATRYDVGGAVAEWVRALA